MGKPIFWWHRRRVWIAIECLSLGGAERTAKRWANDLCEHADVTVLVRHQTPGVHEAALDPRVHVVRHSNDATLLELLDLGRPDVFIANIVQPYVPLMPEIRRRVGRLVCIVHSLSRWSQTFVTPELVALYDKVVVIARYEVEAARRAGIPAAKLACLENPIPCSVVHEGTRSEARAALGLPAGALVLGYAGRADADKGLLHLPAVVHELAERGHDVHLACAGLTEPNFGNRTTFWNHWRDRFVDTVRHAGVEERVHVFPVVHDMRPFYGAIDAAMLLSNGEGSSMFAWESLANGVPVVCTDVGDHREWCVPATGSYIVPRGAGLPSVAADHVELIARRGEVERAECAARARDIAWIGRGTELWESHWRPVLYELVGVSP